jgi:hypothetical protein
VISPALYGSGAGLAIALRHRAYGKAGRNPSMQVETAPAMMRDALSRDPR